MHRTGVTNLFFVRSARRVRSRVLHSSVFRRRGTMFHFPGPGNDEKLLRLAGKPFGAALRTEVVCFSRVFDFGGRFFRNNHHPADGILVLGRPLQNRK